MAQLRFDSLRTHRALSTRRSVFTVASLVASAMMLTILFLSYASTPPPPPRFVDAQSNVTEYNVTPSTFETYFDIDSTTSVATLKTSYKTDVTLVFGAGTYTNPIKIEGANNVTLKAATKATTLNLPSLYSDLPQNSPASVIRTAKIIETTASANRGAIIWIEASTNVTFEGFAMYFDSFVDGGSASRFYGIVTRGSSGTIISDNFIEKVCNPSSTGQCQTSGGAASLKWAIVAYFSPFAPTTDSNDEVTNLVPVSILRNRINEPGIAGIQVQGFYDFTIADNVITGANQNTGSYHYGTGISLVTGASGSVTGNTISDSHEGGINFAPQYLTALLLTDRDIRIVASVTIANNSISESRTAGIQIGGNRCADAEDGTEVDVVATITRNHIFDNYKGVGVTSCYGTDEEDVTVDITANTFEHINTTPHEYGIYGGSVYVETVWNNGNPGVVGKFNVKIRNNVMKDSHRRLVFWVWNNATLDPRSVVDARYNYLDNDRTESPKDPYTAPNGTAQNRFGGNNASKVLYVPWLPDETNAGRHAQNLPTNQVEHDPPLVEPSGSPVLSVSSLNIKESEVAYFTLKLDADPETSVTYTITSPNPSFSFEPAMVTFNSGNWSQPRTITVVATKDANDFDETAEIWIQPLSQSIYHSGAAVKVQVMIADTGTVGRDIIGKIVASTPSISVGPGDDVRLSVDIYGVQDILDNSLADNLPILFWDDGGGGGKFDDDGRRVLYTVPSVPGTYTITVKPPSAVCKEDRLPSPGAGLKNCEAKFEIKVIRKTRTITPTETPSNPDIDVPQIIVGQNNEQCEVFTPESGGRYNGDRFWIAAEPGVVPNGEIVGVCMSDAGPADNAGMTNQRYTLGGRTYRIDLVDVSGMPISSYKLNNPAEVCVPVPNSLRANISKLAIVTQNDDQSLSILASAVRIQDDGIYACGNLSNLPAEVAVGTSGAPEALPTATPEPATDELPDTGGYAPSINAATAILMLLLGMMTVSMFGFILTRRAKA